MASTGLVQLDHAQANVCVSSVAAAAVDGNAQLTACFRDLSAPIKLPLAVSLLAQAGHFC